MDQSDNSNSDQSNQQNDLAKQYQDILDRYSEELASQPPTPDAVPVVEQNPDSVPPETNEPSINQVDQTPLPTETPDNIDIPLTEVPPPILPAPETIPDIQPPIYESTPTDISPPPVIPLVNSPMTGDDQLISSPKSSGGFFKFLFFVSLLIFLGVCAAIVYSILFDSNSNNNSVKPATIQSTPSPISTNVCELNDKKYGVGESFEAADGCNTCTCTPDLLFVCTEIACDITPTVSATTSAIPKSWKTYTNSRYNYSLKYPSDWTLVETDGVAKSTLALGKNIQMVEISNKTYSIKIFFEGDWDHGFEPNVSVLNTSINIGGKNATLTVLKPKSTDKPEGGWAIYSIPDFNDFRIETVYNNEVSLILSTFKFTKPNNPTPTIPKSSAKIIKYNLYPNWLSVRDYSQLFEVAYDSQTEDVKMSPESGITIIRKPTRPDQYITASSNYIIKDYDGGSRHTFLYAFFGGKLTSQDKFSDFKEVEYTIGGKNCLILDGISYSQFPAVWGMCPISNSKALLITTWDRANYTKALSTIKILP